MNANFILNETHNNCNSNQQQSIASQPFHNQMQSLPLPIPHSETENDLFFQRNHFNVSQGQVDSMKMSSINKPNGNLCNNFLPENDGNMQRQQQSMAVSSPSVSSTADLNVGLGNGQNGMRYGGFCAGTQQLDPSAFILQQTTVDDGVRNGDLCSMPQQNALRHSPQFSTMNGHMLNGQNGGMCFPPNFPFYTMPPSTNALQRRTFLFNSDMANNAIKSVQQNLIEDMAGWHLKHCAVVPSTSRTAFEPKRPVNSTNCSNTAPRAANSRGVKRKTPASQSVSDMQQPYSMSLSPHDVRPPSYTSVGHPQSAPLLSNQFDHLQHSNELCDSSTNSDAELFKGSSGQLQQNGSTSNYLQNGSTGQMDENPLKKMEIMTSKTLNEPTNGRSQRLYLEDGSEQNQQIICPVDASKQEKMHKLQEIEKALLPFADTSPTYPNAGPFPADSTQFRQNFFATPSQIMQTPQSHFCAVRPLLGSLPQNLSHKMAVINSNHQMHNTVGEQSTAMRAVDETAVSQQSWAPQ